MEKLDQNSLDEVQKALGKFAEVLKERKIDSRMYIQTGADDAKVAICNVTRDEDCDLLIVGSKGHGHGHAKK